MTQVHKMHPERPQRGIGVHEFTLQGDAATLGWDNDGVLSVWYLTSTNVERYALVWTGWEIVTAPDEVVHLLDTIIDGNLILHLVWIQPLMALAGRLQKLVQS